MPIYSDSAGSLSQQAGQSAQSQGYGLNPLTDFTKAVSGFGAWINSKTKIGGFNPGIGSAAAMLTNAIPGLANLGVQAVKAIGGNDQAYHNLGQAGLGFFHGGLDTAADVMTAGGLNPETGTIERAIKDVTGYQPTALFQYARKPGQGYLGAAVNDVANASLVLDGVGAAAKAGDLGAAASSLSSAADAATKGAVDQGLQAADIVQAGQDARTSALESAAEDLAQKTGDDLDTARAKIQARADMLSKLDTAKQVVQAPLAPWRALRPLARAANELPTQGGTPVVPEASVSPLEAPQTALTPEMAELTAKIAAHSQTVREAAANAPVPEGYTRLYRGGQDGDWWTTNLDRATAHSDGRLQQVDVPTDQIPELAASTQAAATAGLGQPTAGDVYLGNHGGLQQQAIERMAPAPEAGFEAHQAVPTPEEAAQPTVPTQENVPAAYKSFQERVNPAPEWAKKIVDKLPAPMQELLAWSDNLRMKGELTRITRQQTRALAVEARRIQNTPAFQDAIDKATQLVKDKVPGVTPSVASDIVGERIHAAILLGPMWEHLEQLRPQIDAAEPGLTDKLLHFSSDLPEAVNTPEFRQEIRDLAQPIVELRQQASDRMAASKFQGEKGIENRNDENPVLTKAEAQQLEKAQGLVQEVTERTAALNEARDTMAQQLADMHGRMQELHEQLGGPAATERTMGQIEKLQAYMEAGDQMPAGSVRAQANQAVGNLTRLSEAMAESGMDPKSLASIQMGISRLQEIADHGTIPADILNTVDRLAGQVERAKTKMEANDVNTLALRQAQDSIERLNRTLPHEVASRAAIARNAAESAERVQSMQQELVQLGEKRAAVQRSIAHVDELAQTIQEKLLPAQAAIAAMSKKANAIFDRVSDSMEDPSMARVPPKFQEMTRVARGMAAEVEKYPELETVLSTLPKTMSQAIDYATENGFDPTYLPDLTPDKVRQLVNGTARLGGEAGKEFVSGARKTRTGALSAAGLADRSIDALIGGLNQAVQEERTNMIVDWIDRVVAQDIPKNEQGLRVIPNQRNWVEWDETRRGLLGVENPAGERQAVGATQMIPRAVANALKEYQGPSNPFFRAMQKVTNPWRAAYLTWNPAFYAKHFIGHIVLAAAQGGVNPADWANALRSARTGFKDLPEVTGLSITNSEIGRPGLVQWPDVQTAFQQGGVREGMNAIANSLHKAINTSDAFGRAVVYFKEVREGATPQAAMQSAMDALVDYGNLSATERYMVRAVVPFYAFEKGMLQVAARMPFDHPLAAAVLMHVGQWQGDQAKDANGNPLPERYQSVVGVPGLGNVDFRNFTPFKDVASLTTPDGIVSSLQFAVKAVVDSGLGITQPGMKAGVKVGPYGRLVPNVPLLPTLASAVTSSPQGEVLSGAQSPEAFLGLPTVKQSTLNKAGAANTLSQGETALPTATQQKATMSPVDTQLLQQKLAQMMAASPNPLAIPAAQSGTTPATSQVQQQLQTVQAAQKQKAAQTRRSSGGGGSSTKRSSSRRSSSSGSHSVGKVRVSTSRGGHARRVSSRGGGGGIKVASTRSTLRQAFGRSSNRQRKTGYRSGIRGVPKA